MTRVPTLRSSSVDVDGTRLHVVGGGQGAPVLFLHGFPEFWYAWRRQLPALAATHRVFAVDLPGSNLSDKPGDPDAYRLERLGNLIAGLLRKVAPDQRVSLVGHDIGGMIAWDVAARHPELVDRLVAINAPPVAVFARELARSPEQRVASAYIDALRAKGAEVALAARGCERLLAMLEGARPGAIGPADRDAYVQAWSRPGAVGGSLGVYRAWDADPTPSPRVLAPTLVLWGDADPHLLPGCLDDLDAHARHVRIEHIPGATHQVLHEEPERVTEAIRRFLSTPRLDEPVFDVLAEREIWRLHPDYGCFATGPDNPIGLRLTPRVDGGRVWVRTSFERDHSGIVGLAHCGVVFTTLQALMGWFVTSHAGRVGMTTKATIEYHSPVHVGRNYEFEALADPDAPSTSTRVNVMSRVIPVGEPDRPCAVARASFHLPTLEKAEALLGRRIDFSARLFR